MTPFRSFMSDTIEPQRGTDAAAAKPLAGHVYLVDDDEAVREHLAKVLRHYGLTVESFVDVDTFIRDSVELSPAVVISDMVMPGKTGLDLLEKIRGAGWGAPIIFISGLSQPHQIVDAMKLGAVDFLWKPFSLDKLVDSIRKALENDAARLEVRVRLLRVKDRYNKLTEREQEVFRLAVAGYGNIEISRMIDVQPDTVKKHRGRVMEKMQATSLAHLIELYEDLSTLLPFDRS